MTAVSLANLHKRPEALARYYGTSYWQAEWVKKRRWNTIELPPPSPPALDIYVTKMLAELELVEASGDYKHIDIYDTLHN